MKKIISGIALASTLVLAPMVQAAVVNVSGEGGPTGNSSLDGFNSVDISLAAGTYQLTFVKDVYTAFSRWRGEDCGSGTAGCREGWENSVRYIIDDTTFKFGDGDASGGYGPKAGGGYYATADLSLHNAVNVAVYSESFTLAKATDVRFFIYDNIFPDNRGGVSLSVAAVPLPAAAWLFGSAILGLVGVARRKQT